VVLDDVLDKGVTAHFVADHMRSRGAAAVKLAVLADKKTERLHDVVADYRGFELDDVWLVGMGMDDAGAGKEYSRWQDSISEVI
jgi:hypoxanthine phosphoribosyltransferase